MQKKDYIMSYRVYIEDTDSMGIVYHARHLCFFERARSEILRDHGLSLTVMAAQDTYFAVRDVSICYHYPARLDDVLLIRTVIESRKSCSLNFRQTMYNQDDKIISEATVTVVTLDAELKPKRLGSVGDILGETRV